MKGKLTYPESPTRGTRGAEWGNGKRGVVIL
jgi:hypothetical protein